MGRYNFFRTYLDREQHEKVERMILIEHFRFNKYKHKKVSQKYKYMYKYFLAGNANLQKWALLIIHNQVKGTI